MSTFHSARAAVAPVLAATALLAVAGCGSGAPEAPSGAPTAGPSSLETTTAPSPLPSASAPGDVSTTTTSTQAPVPSGGPTEAGRFPVPEGVKVKGPGPQARSWQFDIITKETDSVLAFYRKALADQGYDVKNDVDTEVGAERVHYDIEFSGPAEGFIVADPRQDDVFVLVQSLPTGND